MLTAAGSGYSRWGEHAVTRWREDTTRDDWGSYVFLRDVRSGEVWSAAYQPSGTRPDSYDVMFARGSRGVRRGATARSPRPSTSSCRRRTTPRSGASRSPTRAAESRDIELTSYAEIVLAPPLADVGAPGLLQAVRADRVPRRSRRHPGDAPAPRARASRSCGRPISRSSRARRSATSRSRPTAPASSAAATTFGNAGRRGRRPTPLQHRRHRARSGLRAAPARADPRRAARRGSPSGRWWRPRARRCSTSSTSIRTQRLRAGGRRWPGPRHRCSCAISASRPARPASSSASPAMCSTPIRRCDRSSDTIRRGLAGQQCLWAQGISGDLPIVLVRIDDIEDSARPRAAARPRVLAHEGSGGRSRDPERARRLLRAGPADRPGDAGPHQPSRAPHLGAESEPRRHLRAAQRPDLRRDPRSAARRRARGPARAGAAAWPISSIVLQTPRGVLPPARRKPVPTPARRSRRPSRPWRPAVLQRPRRLLAATAANT